MRTETMSLQIAIDAEIIAQFCRRNHIRKLAFFGSVLTDTFGPESDVDVLVEFEEGCTPGLFALAGMEEALTEILGRKADLRTPEDLSGYFRDAVLRSASVQYAA
jgi:predicted nucleotidyltransferase